MRVLWNVIFIFLLSINCIADDKFFDVTEKEIKSESKVILIPDDSLFPTEEDTLDKISNSFSNNMLQAKLEVAMGKDILSEEEKGWLALIIICFILVFYFINRKKK
jgi:hypothetical protein